MIRRATRPPAGLLLTLALSGQAQAAPRFLLGPDGPTWFGPLPPVAPSERLPFRGVACADPDDGTLWLEADDLVVAAEPMPLRLGRVWTPDGWRWRGISELTLTTTGVTWSLAGTPPRAFPPIWPDPSQPGCAAGYEARADDAVLTCLDQGYRLSLPDGVTERFDLEGHLLARAAPEGADLTLGWEHGDLTWIEGSWGSRITLSETGVTGERRVWVATGPGGQQARFEWNDAGKLTAVTSADGTRKRYHYGGNGALQAVIWSDGSSLEVRRDAEGRVAVLEGPGARRWRYEWGEEGLQRAWDGRGLPWRVQRRPGEITLVDPSTRSATLLLDDMGIAGWRDPAGRTTRLRRDEAGRPILLQDAVGGHWSMAWDPVGRLVRVSDPSGGRWRMLWSNDGRSVRIADPSGHSRGFLLDQVGRVCEISDGLVVRRFLRDAAGLVQQIVQGLGASTRIERDAAGRPKAIVDAVGSEAHLGRYVGVQPGRITDAGGGVWRLVFDLLGRVSGLDAPDGSHVDWIRTPGGLLATLRRDSAEVRFGHRQDGAVTRLIDPLGRVTGWALDAMGRPRSLFQADGSRLDVGHDTLGGIRTLTLGDRHLELRRDALGRPVELNEGSPGSQAPLLSWHRDLAGRIDQVSWPTSALAFTRDLAGLVRAVELGSQRWTLTRDLAGRVVEVEQGEQVWKLQRDLFGRVQGLRGPSGALELKIDPRGLARQADTLGLQVRWRRDGAGRPLQVEGPGGLVLGIQRDEIGNPKLLRLPDGVLLKVIREHGDQQLVLEDEDGGLLLQANVSHDALGRPTAVRGDLGARQLRYGPLGELQSVEQENGAWTVFPSRREGPPGTISVTTDADGRPLEAQIDDGIAAWGVARQTLRWVRDEAGQLTALEGDAGATELTHDPLGRLTAVRVLDPTTAEPLATFTLRWDPFGRPELIEGPGGSTLLRYHEGRLLGLQEGTRSALLLDSGLGLQVMAGSAGHTAFWSPAGAGFELAWSEPLVRPVDFAGPGGRRDPAMPGCLGLQGRIQLFPGGPLVGPQDALDPLTGLPTAYAPGELTWTPSGWPDPTEHARWPEPDGASDVPWDPTRWGSPAPWDDPLTLLVSLDVIAPVIPGPWWELDPGTAPLPWLPADLEGRPPAVLPTVGAMPIREEPVSLRFLQAALRPRQAPDIDEILRLLLAPDLAGLPSTPPGAAPIASLPHAARRL